MKNNIAITASGIVKSFGEAGNETHVLKGVDLTCMAGEMLMIVGPSGCGKTTLLSSIAGTLKINAGKIIMFGQEVSAFNDEAMIEFRRSRIGFIFQQFNLISTLTNEENVAIPLLLAGLSEAQALPRAREWLVKVGLEQKIKTYPRQLSGGQQQRVAIARALVHEPKILICDEPTSSLDGNTGLVIMEMLKNVAQNPERCLIVVTHDSRIFKYGSRFVAMEDGKIRAIYNDEASMLKHYQ